MKLPCVILLGSALTLGVVHAQTTAAIYSEAQRAWLAGDIAVAKEKFLAVLSADPSNAGAKNYLRSIAVAETKNRKSSLSSQLQGLIVPKLSFKDASFDSVLELLKAKATELSDNKINPSFVLQVPPDFSRQTPVTLELSNVPFTEVLRYLGELTATKFEIQEFAIVVKKI